jgi:hypothetical protein
LKDNQIEILEQLQKDPEFIMKNTYPSLIERMGGEDQRIQLFKSTIGMEDEREEACDEGESYVEREKEPWKLHESIVALEKTGKVYQSGDELQVVVKIKDIDVYSNRNEVLKRSQIAISRIGGNFWYFLDAALNRNQIVSNIQTEITKPKEN